MFNPNKPEIKRYVNAKLKEQGERILERMCNNFHHWTYAEVKECLGLSRKDVDRIEEKCEFKEKYNEKFQIDSLESRVLMFYQAIKNPDPEIPFDQVVERAHIDLERLDLEAWKAEPETFAYAELWCGGLLPGQIREVLSGDVCDKCKLSHVELEEYRSRRIFKDTLPDEETVERAYQEHLKGRSDCLGDSRPDVCDKKQSLKEDAKLDLNDLELQDYVNQKLKEQAERVIEKMGEKLQSFVLADVEACTVLSREDVEIAVDKGWFKLKYRDKYQASELLTRVGILYRILKSPDLKDCLDSYLESAGIQRDELDLEAWKKEPEKWAILALDSEELSADLIQEELQITKDEYYEYLTDYVMNRRMCRQIFHVMPPNEETVERAYQEKNDADLRLKESREKETYDVCKAWADQYKYGQEEANRNAALRLFDLGESVEIISAGVDTPEETVIGWLREAGKIAD